jgi:hypothetical protein
MIETPFKNKGTKLYKNSTTFLGRKKEVFDYIDSNLLEIKKRNTHGREERREIRRRCDELHRIEI